ncbi:IQ motif and SEC7 domain-containing protein 1 isoform X3 [Culicoides brevitarsis]|uniref:IQ motif and SEC7 domain-containing protein 1 isoform X3 n=1 Tax=Culicoides brevitarsis TaxID=469753 RepID=UPI00307BEC60
MLLFPLLFNFPQKIADRPSPAYSSHNTSTNSSVSGSGGVGGYVYMQQQPCYSSPQSHHHAQTQLQQSQQPSHYHHHQSGINSTNNVHVHNGGHYHPNLTPTLHKKGSVRNNGDVLKRSRLQNGYELSQDLLDKQIELLERKYGGIKARHAALTIQRAFRHYTMVKKFASITAMAKAEKRTSRRMQAPVVTAPGTPGAIAQQQMLQAQQQQQMQQQYHQLPEYVIDENGQQLQITYGGDQEINIGGQRVCATIQAAPQGNQRITPNRSMSLRERRLDVSPVPRSQSGNASPAPPQGWNQSPVPQTQPHSHPHVNLMHQQHYYSPGAPTQYQPNYQTQQYGTQYGSQELNISIGSQPDSTHSSMNSSWNSSQSPYTPHYTAQQIYMRPRTSSRDLTPPTSASRKMPPEVPRRTSSIISQQQQQRGLRNGLSKSSAENGSLSSVQSSGSDSSASVDRMQLEIASDRSNSPQWKQQRKQPLTAQSPDHLNSMCVADVEHGSSHTSAAQFSMEQQDPIHVTSSNNYKVSETIRKRQYRVGLNLFNKKPEKGIAYLIRRGFLEETPQGVARFLITRKGLSRQMIGEYLGNLQNQFNMAVLDCFAGELDLSGMQVDVALRKFQTYFRMPGEAQKIERLMEIFSQRYCVCNPDIVARLRSQDTIFVLAFAIIMLNTDLHTPNLKPERRMRCDDFIKNLRGIDDCHDIDRDLLNGVYERVKANEFKPGSDHVTQVMKVQATIVGKKPNLALPHRRLVCYCRLYEIPDINKKERPGVHQREVFLFNDLLVITKIFSKKKSSVTYTFRNSFPLVGMVVTMLDVPNYPYCIRLSQKVDNKVLLTFNARNEHDRCKFAEDLRESISEMDEMESLRIEGELDRQKSSRNRGGDRANNSENRDSGVADVEVCAGTFQASPVESHPDQQLKRSALSNSLLDMHEQFGNEKPQRRGSVGSLDSGMSISFQSTSASTGSRSDTKIRLIQHTTPSGQVIVQQAPPPPAHAAPTQPPQRRERKLSRSEDSASNGTGPFGRSTEV